MIESIIKQFAIIAPEIMLTLLALFSQLFAVLFINKSSFISFFVKQVYNTREKACDSNSIN